MKGRRTTRLRRALGQQGEVGNNDVVSIVRTRERQERKNEMMLSRFGAPWSIVGRPFAGRFRSTLFFLVRLTVVVGYVFTTVLFTNGTSGHD